MTICALKTGKPHYLGEFGLNKTAGRDDRPKWKIKILQWKIKILQWKIKILQWKIKILHLPALAQCVLRFRNLGSRWHPVSTQAIQHNIISREYFSKQEHRLLVVAEGRGGGARMSIG